MGEEGEGEEEECMVLDVLRGIKTEEPLNDAHENWRAPWMKREPLDVKRALQVKHVNA